MNIAKKVSYIKLLWLIIVNTIILLSVLGYLSAVKQILDSSSFSFVILDTKISAYLVLKILVVVITLFWLASFLTQLIHIKVNKLKAINHSNRIIINKLSQILIYFVVLLVSLSTIGIDLTALTVFSGALGVGIGIGLQKITSNFLSGIILLFEKSLEVDDYIEFEDGTFGYIRHINTRYTLVETLDGKEVMVPNENFITGNVINWTYSNSKGRVEISIGVSYDSNLEKVQELMLEAALEHPRCMQDPQPDCYLREFADSSVNFLLFFWVKDVKEGRYGPKSEVMLSIWQKFKEHNITIPYPQQDIYIKHIAKQQDD